MIIHAEAQALADLGCTYIQVDAPDIGSIVDPENRDLREAMGMPTERTLTEGPDIFNGIGDAPGVTFAVHVCEGNNMSQWIVSSKTTTLESPAEITARVNEAAKYTGLDRLALSTQCGFSSTLPGANLTNADVQERKPELVAEAAHSTW